MSKWSFVNSALVTLNKILVFASYIAFQYEVPDDAQINDELYTFLNVFNQKTICNLTPEKNSSFSICSCYFGTVLLQIICQMDIDIEWIF